VYNDFFLAVACQECPVAVYTSNVIAVATAVVGGVSVVACLATILVIIAWRKDSESPRFRVIIGLMIANAVYSMANTIPMDLLETGIDDCGEFTMSSADRAFGRAW